MSFCAVSNLKKYGDDWRWQAKRARYDTYTVSISDMLKLSTRYPTLKPISPAPFFVPLYNTTSKVAARDTGVERAEAAMEAVWTRLDWNLHHSLRRGVRRHLLSAGHWPGET